MKLINRVAIIDYKMNNLFSIQAACKYNKIDTIITSDHDEIMSSKFCILPGIGAYNAAMKKIISLKLDKTIKEFINTGRSFLGICLGFQLLFQESEEYGKTKGLNILKGKIRRFNFKNQKNQVPYIGWNKINKEKSWAKTILKQNTNNKLKYFVHSYYLPAEENEKIMLASSNYNNIKFCSVLKMGNIYATQFHPEKSGKSGLDIIKNFAK